jgi:competence protein ComEC
MQSRWEEAPFAPLTACLAAGVGAAIGFETFWFPAVIGSGLALLGAAAAAWAGNRLKTSLCCALAALAPGGLAMGLATRDRYPAADVRALLARASLPLATPLLLDAWVLEDGARRGPDLVTTLQLRGIRFRETWRTARGLVQLRISLPADAGETVLDVHYGDRVRAWAECDVPRNFRNPGSPDRAGLLARRGIHLLARVRSPRLIEVLPADAGNPWNHAIARVRRSLEAQLARLRLEGNPQRAAVLSSLILGDYAGLSDATRSEFQNAGTYHVLVVSGLHVSTIAWVLIQLLRLLRVPVPAARLLAAAGILFFTGLVGFQASITRSLWMFVLYLIAQCLFRRASPVNILFACAFLLLAAHPSWLQDTGFQLSFLSVAAIVLTGVPVMERILRPLMQPLRHAGDPQRLFIQPGRASFWGRRLRIRAELLAEACTDRFGLRMGNFTLKASRAAGAIGFAATSTLMVSLAVQIWLEPVLAFNFNRLSWVAPVANLAVVPLSSLVLIAGMAAEVLTLVARFAWPVFRASGAAAALLLDVNRWFSALPGAWQRCPTPPGVLVAIGVLAWLLWSLARWRRLWIPCVLTGLGLAGLALSASGVLPRRWGPWAPAPGMLRLSFLDVGQGDSIVIEFPDARVWVVDAGGLRLEPSKPEDGGSYDIGEAVVSRFLWSRWTVALERVLLTHPHQDHAGGIPALIGNFPVGGFDYAHAADDETVRRLVEKARACRVPAHGIRAGEEYRVGGVTVRVLNPAPKYEVQSINDRSAVLYLTYGNFHALLPGDLEGTGEARMLNDSAELKCQLLKVAHHGSRNATLESLLDHVRPRWAVISAGRKNPFGNPARETLLRLLRHGARLLQTMDQGAIYFETDGACYRLSSYNLGLLESGVL